MDNKSPEAFRTISEVADWLGVPAHVLRFWESRFGQVKPVKRAGGRRYYRPSDMELLGGIRKLLHDDGMTIRGVQKLLRENGVKHVAAMSPPIDQPADLRDVSPQDAPPLEADSDRAAPIFDNAVEDAVQIETAAKTPAPSEAPAETGTGADADADSASKAETGDAAMFDAVDKAETAAPEAEDVRPVFAVEPVPSEQDTEEDADAETPLDGPEAIDFFAHEAQPETVEQAGPLDDFVPEIAREADAPAPLDASGAQDDTADATPEAAAPVPADAGPTPEPQTPDAAEEAARQADDAAEPAASPASDTPAPTPEFAGDVPVSRPETAPDDSPSDAAAPDEPGTEPQTAPQEPTPRPAETPTSAEEAEALAAAKDATAHPGADSTDLTPPGIETAPHPAPAEPPARAPAEPPVAPPDSVAAADAAPGETEPDMSATEVPATQPAEPAQPVPDRPAAARPDLVMPDIGPDPEDDAEVQTQPALAAALRRQRPHTEAGTAGARLNPALLQAYADRLQALSGRLGATPDGRRPF